MNNKKKQDYLVRRVPDDCGKSGCDSYGLRRDLIHKIIDGQANEEEYNLYNKIIDGCTNCKCRQYCEQELAIKNLIQSKLDRIKVPLDIVEKIKTRIHKAI